MNYYMLKSVEYGPIVLEKMVGLVDPARFDERPDADRFTLREAVAHLADWEPIFLTRMQKTLAQPGIEIENLDEGEIAVKNEYHKQDVAGNIARFKAGRSACTAFLRSLGPDDWSKACYRSDVGTISLEDFANMMTGHDMYHLEHAAQFLG